MYDVSGDVPKETVIWFAEPCHRAGARIMIDGQDLSVEERGALLH
jgi:hypothetical protein